MSALALTLWKCPAAARQTAQSVTKELIHFVAAPKRTKPQASRAWRLLRPSIDDASFQEFKYPGRYTPHWQSQRAFSASGHDFFFWPRGGGSVSRGARVSESAVVNVGAVVHSGAVVGESCCIGSGSVVCGGVEVGDLAVIGPSVTLQNCRIGRRTVLHPGVRIGQDGFGFFINDSGDVVKKPQELRVVIEDDVEIGANSCVDRGSWRDTRIGEGTKIDNMVQVGHNVTLGRRCIICAHCAIGGSAELGDYVVMGGKAAVKDHVKITSKVRIAAKAGVAKDITKSGDYAGFPAMEAALWRRSVAQRKR